MRILVLGGAGWIGGITTRLLEEAGHEVTVFDNLSTGQSHNVGKSRLVQGDLTDRAAVTRLFDQPYDIMVHFAAKLDVGESMAKPHLYFENNLVGSLNLIDTAVNHGVKKLIFSSSATVYGEPSTVPIPETAEIKPINPYGFSKVMVEELMASYQLTHGLQWLALRYFNPIGAYQGIRQNPKVSNIVPTALRALKTGVPLKVFGNDYDTPDGTGVRDYVDVREIAAAHVVAAEKMAGGTSFNRAINLGASRGFSVLEVLVAIGKAAGAEVPRQFAPRRAGDAASVVASSDLARELLGWSAQKGLDEMVKTAVNKVSSSELSSADEAL